MRLFPVFHGDVLARVQHTIDWVHDAVRKTVWEPERLRARLLRRSIAEILADGDVFVLAPCAERTAVAGLVLVANEIPFTAVVHERRMAGLGPATGHTAIEFEDEQGEPYWFDFGWRETRFFRGTYFYRSDIEETIQLLRFRSSDFDVWNMSIGQVLDIATPSRVDWRRTKSTKLDEKVEWYCRQLDSITDDLLEERLVFDARDSVYAPVCEGHVRGGGVTEPLQTLRRPRERSQENASMHRLAVDPTAVAGNNTPTGPPGERTSPPTEKAPSMQAKVSSTAAPAVRLALATLFGEEFLEHADPNLVASFERSGSTWADLIVAMWRLQIDGAPAAPPAHEQRSNGVPEAPQPRGQRSNGSSQVPSGLAASPRARIDAEPPARPAPPQPTRARPPQLATPTPATPAYAQDALEVFDPAVDELATRYAARPRTREEVRAFLVELLVEKTGYPPETFEDDLDLEVDLGIDTVKQIEVLAAVRQAFQLTVDENFRMRDYNTLGAATSYIAGRLEREAQPGSSGEREEAEEHDADVATL